MFFMPLVNWSAYFIFRKRHFRIEFLSEISFEPFYIVLLYFLSFSIILIYYAFLPYHNVHLYYYLWYSIRSATFAPRYTLQEYHVQCVHWIIDGASHSQHDTCYVTMSRASRWSENDRACRQNVWLGENSDCVAKKVANPRRKDQPQL